jgi:Outer membrane protein beta-barrel family
MFNSLYATLLRGFGDLGVQLGLRAERADTKLELPSGESFDNDYFSFFPSGNISYEVAEGKQLRLSYSRRIRRPSPRIMNPTDRSDDPLYRRVGNPDIEPQYTHSLSFDASASTSWGNIRLSPYYRRITNDWADIQTVDAAGIATTTWKNIATTENYGASVTASLRRTGGWGGFASFSTHREVRDASNLANDYSGSSLRWSARTNVSGNLTSTLSMRATASYTPAREVPQGRRSERFMTHLGFRQRLMDGRASINLTVSDPFDLYDSTFQSRDLTYQQIGRSEEQMRAATISFSWSFGGLDADDDRGAGRGGPGRR